MTVVVVVVVVVVVILLYIPLVSAPVFAVRLASHQQKKNRSYVHRYTNTARTQPASAQRCKRQVGGGG